MIEVIEKIDGHRALQFALRRRRHLGGGEAAAAADRPAPPGSRRRSPHRPSSPAPRRHSRTALAAVKVRPITAVLHSPSLGMTRGSTERHDDRAAQAEDAEREADLLLAPAIAVAGDERPYRRIHHVAERHQEEDQPDPADAFDSGASASACRPGWRASTRSGGDAFHRAFPAAGTSRSGSCTKASAGGEIERHARPERAEQSAQHRPDDEADAEGDAEQAEILGPVLVVARCRR